MVKFNTFFIISLLTSTCFFAQDIGSCSPRSNALGNTTTTISDVTLAIQNPLSTIDLKSLEVAIQEEHFFSLPTNHKTAILVAKPLKKGVVGFGCQAFGLKEFQSAFSGFNYCLNLHKNFSLGLFLGGNYLAIKNYGSLLNLQYALAFKGKITEKLMYGILFQSVNRGTVTISNQNTSLIHVGIKYKSSENLDFYSEFQKSFFDPIRFKFACEYSLNNALFFRLGVITSAYTFTSGFGCVFNKHFRFDVSCNWQSTLGLAIQSGLVFKMISL